MSDSVESSKPIIRGFIEERESGGGISMLFAVVGAMVAWKAIADLPDEWRKRTRIGKAVFLVEAPIMIVLAAVCALAAVVMGVFGVIELLPAFLFYAYKKVVYKDDVA